MFCLIFDFILLAIFPTLISVIRFFNMNFFNQENVDFFLRQCQAMIDDRKSETSPVMKYTCNAERDKYQKWNVKFSEKDFQIGSMYIHIISTASLCKWCCRDIWISSNLWSMQNLTKSCWRSSISVPDRKVGTILVWIYVVESGTSICHSY